MSMECFGKINGIYVPTVHICLNDLVINFLIHLMLIIMFASQNLDDIENLISIVPEVNVDKFSIFQTSALFHFCVLYNYFPVIFFDMMMFVFCFHMQ